ncbi:Nucleotidylyl transferase [Xylariaceae sp. FL0255]|nr:Nucleotidylyl transferase [Xylariaceae sp. FL0255]
MARLQTPANLQTLFSQALKNFQQSESTFRVLCSIPSSAASSENQNATDGDPLSSGSPPKVSPKYILVLDSSFNPPTLAHQRMALSALSDPRYRSNAVIQVAGAKKELKGRMEMDETSRVLLLLAINNADKAPKPAAFPERLAMMYIFAHELLKASAAQSEAQAQIQTQPTDIGVLNPTTTPVTACRAVDIAVTTEPYFFSKSLAIATSDWYTGAEARRNSIVSTDNAADSEQIYLTGFDTLIRIFDPKYYPDNSMKRSLDPLFAYSRLTVTMRTDDSWGDESSQLEYLEGLKEGGKLVEVGGRREWADRIEMVKGREEGEEVVSSTKVRDAVKRKDWDALGRLVSQDIVAWIRERELYAEEG